MDIVRKELESNVLVSEGLSVKWNTGRRENLASSLLTFICLIHPPCLEVSIPLSTSYTQSEICETRHIQLIMKMMSVHNNMINKGNKKKAHRLLDIELVLHDSQVPEKPFYSVAK